MPQKFTCTVCGESFTLPAGVLERYPGWTPRKCRKCHGKKARNDVVAEKRPPPAAAAPAITTPEAPVLPPGGASRIPPGLQQRLDEVLRRYHDGPTDGIFTDGGCSGNPGPGGWGAVYVRDNQLVAQRFGREAQTTNNRMELMALTAAMDLIVGDEEVTIWSDSQLCVNTLTLWAPRWEAKGWRRKGGPIKNLDLIRPLYELVQARPNVTFRWVKAHAGSRWNEYVDALATAPL